MNISISIILTFFTFSVYTQSNPIKKAQPIINEGKQLYKSEMASWHGTDIFLKKYNNKKNIGGYFSYAENDETTKCIFFSKSDNSKVIGTISFDKTSNTKTAKTDLKERAFSNKEKDIYEIRKNALAEINSDTIFKRYNNTNFNLIPLITKTEKKVYVLTAPKHNGVVIFGNDYLLTFDKNNKLLLKKRLHKNIIPIAYGKEKDGKEIQETIHSHLPETGDFITATDVCTLMIYEKFTKWKTHHIVSKKYLNIWNCETDELTVVKIDDLIKIKKDQGK